MGTLDLWIDSYHFASTCHSFGSAVCVMQHAHTPSSIVNHLSLSLSLISKERWYTNVRINVSSAFDQYWSSYGEPRLTYEQLTGLIHSMNVKNKDATAFLRVCCDLYTVLRHANRSLVVTVSLRISIKSKALDTAKQSP
jgi:hypothetical protein